MSLSMSWIVMCLFGVSVVTAVEPAIPSSSPTRQLAPVHRPDPSYSGVVVDMTKPAYIPNFAMSQPVVALEKERDRIIRLEPRPGLILPWGYAESVYISGYPRCP